MRAFAWLLVVAGLVLAIGWGSYAYFESEHRYATWSKREGLSVDFRTWTRAAAIRDAGERPAWTVVDPWPGVIAGVVSRLWGSSSSRFGGRSGPMTDRWLRRALSTQRGLHVERQIIVALSREHDWPGGLSDLPLGALGRKRAPGLEVKLLGEMYRQQADSLQQGRCRDGQLDGRQFIHRGQPGPSMLHRRLSRAITAHR